MAFQRPILRYIYGKPPAHRATLVKLALDTDLADKLSGIASQCNWHEGHLYRYLLLLGLHQFRLKSQPHEDEVGIVHDDDSCFRPAEKD